MAFVKGWTSAAALLALAILASSCRSSRAAWDNTTLPSPFKDLTGIVTFNNQVQVSFWSTVALIINGEEVGYIFNEDVVNQTTIEGNTGIRMYLYFSDYYFTLRLDIICSQSATEITSFTPPTEEKPVAVVNINTTCPSPSLPTLVFKSYARLSFPKAGEITKLAAGIDHGRALISVESVKTLFAETVVANLASEFPAFASWFLTGAGAPNTSRITFLDFSYTANIIGVTYTIDLPETGFAVGSAGIAAINAALRSPTIFTGSLTNALGPVTVQYVAYVCLASGGSCVNREDVPIKRSVDDDAVSIGVGVGVGVGLTLLAVIGYAVKYWWYDAKQMGKGYVVDGAVAGP